MTPLRSVDGNFKQWFCYMHVKCIGSVSRMIQHYDCLVFSGNCLWCFLFDALFYTYQHLWIIECWKTSICQYLNFPFVPHSIFCFRILKIQKSFTKKAQHSSCNICLRSVLTSVHEQQLHSLEDSVKLLPLIHLHILSEAILDKTGITDHLLCFNLWTNFASTQPFSINDAWIINETYQYKPSFLSSHLSSF